MLMPCSLRFSNQYKLPVNKYNDQKPAKNPYEYVGAHSHSLHVFAQKRGTNAAKCIYP